MPASSATFPWPSYYGHFKFFEDRIRVHSKVRSVVSLGNGLFSLDMKSGEVMKVFVCDCYSFGVAEYFEVVANAGAVDAVVISSNWCGYTADAKRHCRSQKVGLFSIGAFMASLNSAEPALYLTSDEKEDFKKRGWL